MVIFHKDESGRTTRIQLESADEVAEFKKMTDLADRLRNIQKVRAEKVFAAILAGNETVDIDDQSDSASIAANKWAHETDEVIRECLDHRSISVLIALILDNHQSARQAANAIKRHAENHAMKADVFGWLDTNMVNFKSMDVAAQAVIKQQPIAFRTAREWVAEWKKLRSASTP